MKSKRCWTLTLIIIAICTVSVLFLLNSTMERNRSTTAISARSHPLNSGKATKSNTITSKLGTAKFSSDLRDHGRRWLDSQGRDATSLMAMWYITGDNIYINEAMDRFPDAPIVRSAVFRSSFPSNSEVEIEQLIEANPASSEGLFLKAGKLCNLYLEGVDNIEVIVALLQKAISLPYRRDAEMKSQINAAYEAALACGVNEGDAVRLALAGPILGMKDFSEFNSIAKSLGVKLAELKDSGEHTRQLEIAQIGILIAEKLKNGACNTSAESGAALMLAKEILSDFGDNIFFDQIGKSVKELKLEFSEFERQFTEFNADTKDAEDILEKCNTETARMYFMMFLEHGELYARRWLIANGDSFK